MDETRLKIVMFPWFAMGHITSFVHISNKLAERGHTISFILPQNTQSKVQTFNLHPHSITFIPITVPSVPGLPAGTETTADIPFPLGSHLRRAMDLTAATVESLLQQLNPQFVFFDFAHWLPALARRLGIKSVHYCTISPAAVAYMFQNVDSPEQLMEPPPGFPSSSAMIRLRKHEALVICRVNNGKELEEGMTFVERVIMAVDQCDALGFKSCREIEGLYCEFLERRFRKPVYLAGPVLPNPPTSSLNETTKKWLDRFKPKSVIYCAFGSEARLKLDQFRELLSGLELTKLPFLAALKPPLGAETVTEALPEGFNERTKERGVVDGGWVQQQVILSHPSVGCFVTHCGSGSLSEAMVNECQLVLVPHVGDQVINARVMGGELRVGVEVERGEEDGLFTKEGVRKAVSLVMEDDSEVGREVRINHGKWREFFLRKGLEDSYIDDFVKNLVRLL